MKGIQSTKNWLKTYTYELHKKKNEQGNVFINYVTKQKDLWRSRHGVFMTTLHKNNKQRFSEH